MEKINKLSLPATLLITSIVLGGFYYATQVSKQNSIERQQQTELQAKKDADQAEKDQEASIRLSKMFCVDEAQQSAVNQYETSSLCTGSYTSKDCKDGKTYLIAQYDNAYDTCLQRKGLK